MQQVTIAFDSYKVGGLLLVPSNSKILLILGHGAGAGMNHSFMEQLAMNLAEQEIATLRYNFPYMEEGRRSPNSPAISQATVRAVTNEAKTLAPNLALVAGGKSYGGRMTSQAQAKSPLPGVRALVFFGFPLHAPGRPGDQRGQHLHEIDIPMLFLQGTRDKLAELNLMRPLCDRLKSIATLEVIEGADHGFSMLKRSQIDTTTVRKNLAQQTREWLSGAL